jgi:peptidoglycan/xylan/chitin deacetylase (PgdA/CDA1 family)
MTDGPDDETARAATTAGVPRPERGMMGGGRPALVPWAAAGLYRAGLMGPLAGLTGYVAGGSLFQVLTYHRVNDERDPFFGAVPTDVFERQMAYLARHYRVLTVEELVERMRDHRLPRNAVAVTFDDGYRDTLTHAAPILARYGLPATIFLATGFIGTGEVPWVDRLALALRTTTAASVTPPGGGALRLTDTAARLRALEATLVALKRLAEADLRRTVDDLVERLGVPDAACLKGLMLTWDDVHALAGLGFSIGAHTVNHPILSRVAPERAWSEITGSRTMIASACGRTPTAFAYPNGRPEDYTETVTRMVREAGFTCAVTTRFGVNRRQTSPYELRRGGAWEHHLPTFALKMAVYHLGRS